MGYATPGMNFGNLVWYEYHKTDVVLNGSAEVDYIVPPPNEIWRLRSLHVDIQAVPGAGGGGAQLHSFYLSQRYWAGLIGYINQAVLYSNGLNWIGVNYGQFFVGGAGSTCTPANLNEQYKFCYNGICWCSNTVQLRVQYGNSSGANMTLPRDAVFLFEVSKSRF